MIDDVVGERGVLMDVARSATVTAVTHMITYAISRERFRSVVDGNPAAREWMHADMLVEGRLWSFSATC